MHPVYIETAGHVASHTISQIFESLPNSYVAHGTRDFERKTAKNIYNVNEQSAEEYILSMKKKNGAYKTVVSVHAGFDEKISSICESEVFLCPVDYPYLYMPTKKSEIFLGHNYHWRSVDESLLTFMTSKKMLDKHIMELNNMALTEHSPFEAPLHKIYKNEICLSPVPSLALHCTNVNSVFGLSPNIDWLKIWNDSKKI